MSNFSHFLGHFKLVLVDMLLAISEKFFLQVHASPGFAYCQLSDATYVGAWLRLVPIEWMSASVPSGLDLKVLKLASVGTVYSGLWILCGLCPTLGLA